MPAAQVGYPLADGSAEAFELPADFVTEAIDQTRGWFYSLLAVNVLVFGTAPYRHVMCLGHIVDAEGRKMSKSVGNVIDPWEIIGTRGADPLRWWMFSQGSPWTPTRVSLTAIDTAMRDTLLTLWNTFSFFTLYASLNGFEGTEPGIPAPEARPEFDRWVRSRLASTAAVVTAALDDYDPLPAASALAQLVDDVSNWYVRRSRRRFWRTDPGAPPEDSLAAHATLLEVLVELSLLLAPLCPFVADHLWRALTGSGDECSVHLADWPIVAGGPTVAGGRIDPVLEAEMAQARRLVSLGRAARAEAGVKVRQPLAKALVFVPLGAPRLLEGVVSDELNVDQVEVVADVSHVLHFELVPNFKVLGPRLGDLVQGLRKALATVDGAAAAATLEGGGSLVLDVGGRSVELGPGDVALRVKAQPGFAVSRQGNEVVALDLALSDELRARGLARDLIRQVQDLRKQVGFEVSDRIVVHLVALDDLEPLFGLVGTEVLATEVRTGAPEPYAGSGWALELEGHPGARAWLEKA
jgi:isoleucyl-tRNA synthetase